MGTLRKLVDTLRTHPTDTTAEYWDWFAVAAYLLITVDLLMTLYAAAVVGSGAEANPIVRWAIGRGVTTLVVLNIAAVVLIAVVYRELLRLYAGMSGRRARVVGLGVELWLGLTVAVGLFVFANNLATIVYGMSLL